MNLTFTSLDLWYVPIIIFASIMFIALLVGFFNGYAVALYFLIGEIIFFGIGIGIYSVIYPYFTDLFIKFIPDSVKKTSADAESFLNSLKSPIGYGYMIITLLIGMMVIFPFYFVFRKWLKRSHYKSVGFEEKKAKLYSRGLGVVVAGCSGLMFAAPLTTMAYVVTTDRDKVTNNLLFKFNSAFVSGISFDAYSHPMRFQSAMDTIELASDKHFQDLISAVANKNWDGIDTLFRDAITVKHHDVIESIINDVDLLSGSKNAVVDLLATMTGINLKSEHSISFIDFRDNIVNDSNSLFNKIGKGFVDSGVPKFHLSETSFDIMFDSLTHDYLKFENTGQDFDLREYFKTSVFDKYFTTIS